MGIPFHRSKSFILMLGITAALVGGSAASGASAAPKDGGTYDCKNGKTWFDQRVKDYNNLKNSNPSAAADAKRDAEAEKQRAKDAGCDVSEWAVPFVRDSSGFYSPVSGGLTASLGLSGSGTTAGSTTSGAASTDPPTP